MLGHSLDERRKEEKSKEKFSAPVKLIPAPKMQKKKKEMTFLVLFLVLISESASAPDYDWLLFENSDEVRRVFTDEIAAVKSISDIRADLILRTEYLNNGRYDLNRTDFREFKASTSDLPTVRDHSAALRALVTLFETYKLDYSSASKIRPSENDLPLLKLLWDPESERMKVIPE